MDLIDTHCHLKGLVDDGSLQAVLQRAQAAGVRRMIAVSTNAADAKVYAELSAAFPKKIFHSLGLHPCYVDKNFPQALECLKKQGSQAGLVALGEIGLDAYHLPKNPQEASHVLALQTEAFKRQLEWAQSNTLPIIIHSRNTLDACLEILKQSGIAAQRLVFHCFSEDAAAMQRLNALGIRASFTGIITYKNAHNVRQALLAQGPELLMLETDAPYLAPHPLRGKPNEPAFLTHIAQAAADCLHQSAEALATQTTRNAELFYSLSTLEG